MHPIEHLRYLARLGDAPPSWLVPEAADALRGLVGDRPTLVMGCRKLLEHHPLCGPMWWLCGHVVTAREPRRVLDELATTFDRDPTSLQLSLALSDVDPVDDVGPWVVETPMAGRSGVVVPESAGLSAGAAVWVAAGVGTVVVDEVFAASTRDIGRGSHLLPLDAVARVIRPGRIGGTELLQNAPDVPFVPELLARH